MTVSWCQGVSKPQAEMCKICFKWNSVRFRITVNWRFYFFNWMIMYLLGIFFMQHTAEMKPIYRNPFNYRAIKTFYKLMYRLYIVVKILPNTPTAQWRILLTINQAYTYWSGKLSTRNSDLCIIPGLNTDPTLEV